MTKDEFLKKVAGVLQTEAELTYDTVLGSLEEWDSLGAMGIMSFLNKEFNVKVNLANIFAMKKVEDIAKKAGL